MSQTYQPATPHEIGEQQRLDPERQIPPIVGQRIAELSKAVDNVEAALSALDQPPVRPAVDANMTAVQGLAHQAGIENTYV